MREQQLLEGCRSVPEFLPQQRESVASIANLHFCVVSGSPCSLHPLVAILLPLGRMKRKEFVCLWCF